MNEKMNDFAEWLHDAKHALEREREEMEEKAEQISYRLNALRVFVNKSKRKKLDKRIAVKEMVLEMAFANGVTLPEDLAANIECLDDEQPEAKVVNVAGNYNDIHDNGSVNMI